MTKGQPIVKKLIVLAAGALFAAAVATPAFASEEGAALPRTRAITLRSGGILPKNFCASASVSATWTCSPALAPVKLRLAWTSSSDRPRSSAMRE